LVAAGCRVQVKNPESETDPSDSSRWNLHDPTKSFTAQLRYAVATESIQPEKPIPLSGFGGIGRRLVPPGLNAEEAAAWQIPYKKVDIAPRVKVMLFQAEGDDQAKHTFSIISLDVVGISKRFKSKIVKSLAKRYPEANFSQSSLQMVATHSHSGPAGLAQDPMFETLAGDRYNESYFDFVEQRILDTYQKAFASLENLLNTSIKHPIEKGFNSTRLDGMEVDARVRFADLYSWSQRGCLISFALHPTTFGQKEQILSPDIGGHIERAFESTFGAQGCIFLPGVIGNASTKLGSRSRTDYSNEMANALFAASVDFSQNDAIRFAFGGAPVTLPEATINARGCEIEKLDATLNLNLVKTRDRRTEVGFLALGQTAWIFLPGEVLQDAAKSIEKAVLEAQPELKNVILVSAANDYVGYLMKPSTYDKPSLESCSALFPPSSYKILESAAIKLARKMKF
jgi:hypothetical protein